MCETGADKSWFGPGVCVFRGLCSHAPVIFNKFYKMDFQWPIASQPLGQTHANELIRMRRARAGAVQFYHL